VVGNYNTETKTWDPLTQEQIESTAFLVNSLKTTYSLTNTDIYSHENIQPKTQGEGQVVFDAIYQYLKPSWIWAPPPAQEQIPKTNLFNFKN
jgi:N-acetyl-anhydromuramyl-L-alanine amidase AmpD